MQTTPCQNQDGLYLQNSQEEYGVRILHLEDLVHQVYPDSDNYPANIGRVLGQLFPYPSKKWDFF